MYLSSLSVFLCFDTVIFPGCCMVSQLSCLMTHCLLLILYSMFYYYQSLLMGTFYQFVYYCYVNMFGYTIYKMHLGPFTRSGVS